VKPKVPRTTILWIFLAAAAWTPSLIAAPSGEPAEHDFKIDRQPLGAALQEFAKQSGVQIIFFSQVAEGLQAPALRGHYTLTAALQVLLGHSQLTFQVINPKTVAIRLRATNDAPEQSDASAAKGHKPKARPDIPNDPSKTASTGNANSLDEVVVSGSAEGLVATRTQTPLREIPQTISLISQEQIRQENDTDLADVLSNAVGITAVQNNSLDKAFISRGFTITTFHVDGSAALNSFSNTPIFGTPDLGEFDHVEVLRGSDALFGGIGNPGATVNIIRKRPLETGEAQFSAYGGSWNNYRGEADVTGPLGFDGALRARLDIVFGDRDYFFEPASLERRKVFGVLEYDLTARTLLTVGGSYQWNNAVPFINGLPFYLDGSDAHLPRSMALAFNWSRYDTQTREYYAQLQQKFGGAWQLKLNATSLDTAAQYDYGAFDSPINPLTKALPALPFVLYSPSPNTQDQFAFDGTLTGSFELFTRRVDVAVGGDYTHFKGDVAVELVNSFGPAVSNVFAFNPAAYPTAPLPSPPFDQSRATTNQSGEFASARVYLTEALSVVGGARNSSNRLSNTVSFTLAGSTADFTQVVKDGDKVTPFFGATYDVSSHYSLYASYADIYQTNNGERTIGGAFLSPADGIDRELGIKGSWRNSTLNGFVVLYGIDQRGLAVFDTNASVAEQQAFPMCCYLPDGTNKSKGVDAELNGTLTPGWLIGAGYTFNINHAFEGGDLSSETPRHLLKLWSSTQLSGDFQRWTIGGNIQAQSSNFSGGYACPQPTAQGYCMVPQQIVREVQGPFALINLRAGYQITAHWRGALSINNVFDRIYYQTIGYPTGGNWYGEPRGYVLRIDGRY
jgi:outer membrane receptor for ferric coprogen and ferric-rhodotorulic acid